jgi:mannose-6-phosphate isomerase-like protein (cupin superfamily)
MKVAEAPKEGLEAFTIADAYEAWLKKEGVTVYKEFYFPSLAEIELGPWERKGGNGAVIHIANRHMLNDCHVVEIQPGGKSEPEHHMYELTIYVLSGRGGTTIWHDEKHKQTFEWQAGSLFCIPLNAWYQNFNGSGNEPVRYIAVTNAPPMMRLFRDDEFIFNSDFRFRSRYSGDDDYFSGNGKLFQRRVWESNFIANAPDMLLYGWKERGAGGVNAMLEMADNNMKNHISEFPVGTYKKATDMARAPTWCCSAALAASLCYGPKKTAPTWSSATGDSAPWSSSPATTASTSTSTPGPIGPATWPSGRVIWVSTRHGAAATRAPTGA